MKYSPYSYSRISTHQQCPKKFKYVYIDKVKVPFVYNEALIKGGALHSILEHYPNTSPHKRREKYQHIADKFLETDLAREIYFGENKRELNVGLTKDLIPCDYYSKDAMFRGSVDFMFMTTDCMVLIDWKSGKLRDPKYQTYTQLLWYALYFFKKYEKLDEIKISYVFIEHENESRTLDLHRNYLEEYEMSLVKEIDKIEQDTQFDINISPLCNYCDFQDMCEAERNDSIPNDFLSEL